jgi:hypothetical protein
MPIPAAEVSDFNAIRLASRMSLEYAELARNPDASCSTYHSIARTAQSEDNWRRLLWASEKAQHACSDEQPTLKWAMMANLHLNRPHQAYRHWLKLQASQADTLSQASETPEQTQWRIAISHSLVGTPYAPFAPPEFRVESGPWQVEKAMSLSMIPGLGQFYLGQWGLGAHYLSVNALFAAFVGWRLVSVAEAWRSDKHSHSRRATTITSSLDIALIAGLIWPRYWNGARTEAQREAERRNKEWHQQQIRMPQ